MMRLACRLLFLTVCGLLPAGAQQNPLTRLAGAVAQPGASPAPPSNELPPPKSYAPDRIFTEMEASERVVRQITGRSGETPRLREIQDSLPSVRTAVTKLVDYTESLLKADPSLGQMRDLQNTWRVTLDRLSNWQGTLQSASAQTENDLVDLRTRESAWRQTLSEAGRNELPAPVVAQVNRIVESVNSAHQRVLDFRNRVLSIRSEVSVLQVQVDTALDHLNTAVEKNRADLLLRDSAPVWGRPQPGNAVQEPATFEGEDLKGIARFVLATFLQGLLVYLVVYLLILIPMLVVRRRASVWTKDDDVAMRRLGRVVGRPFSAAIMLTMPVAFLLTGRPPDVVLNLIGLLLLIPLVRVVPLVVSPHLNRSVYLLGVLFALDRFSAFLPAFSAARRWMLLALTVVAAMAFVWQDRRTRPDQLWVIPLPVLRVLLRAAVGLLAASALLNLVGYVSLSQSLTAGVVTSLYGAILVHSSAMIAQSIATFLLRPLKTRTDTLTPERVGRLQHRARIGITFLSLLALLLIVLTNFGILGAAWKATSAVLNAPIHIGAIQITLSGVVTFALAMFVAFVLSDMLRLVLDLAVFPRAQMQPGSAKAVSQLANYGVLFLGFLFASSAAGLDMTKFAFLAGAIGVGVGLGLQSIVNNFISGLILLFERPVHIGDRVTIKGGVDGVVSNIGIRASTVRTWDGADVVVPNGDLLSGDLTNWTLSDTRRRSELRIGVGYGTDPDKVIQLLLAAAKSHPKVDRFPAPHAIFTGFGDSSLNFILRFWTHFDDMMFTASEVHVAVNRSFAEAGIEIPFPQRDVHIRTEA